MRRARAEKVPRKVLGGRERGGKRGNDFFAAERGIRGTRGREGLGNGVFQTAKYPHEIREDSLRFTQHDTGGRSHIAAPETGALRRKGAETVAIRCLL